MTAPTAPAARVATIPIAHGVFHGLHVATPDIFALSGHIRTGPALAPGDAVLHRLTTALVASGAQRRGSSDIADLLEARGIAWSVEPGLDRVRFSLRACTADLHDAVALLAACLRGAEFDEAGVASEQARLAAELQYHAIDPAAAAAAALTRLLYPALHPAYEADPAEQLAQLERFTAADVRRCHRERFGTNDLRIAVVGDIDPSAVARVVDAAFATWSPSPPVAAATPDDAVQAPDAVRVTVPGQTSFGVALGQRLARDRADPDAAALALANRILGGAFASRLVRQVRERRGLAYVVRSELAAQRRGDGGHWQVSLSAGADALDDALAATRDVIAEFARDGARNDEFETARRAAVGAFHVGLATLDGINDAILSAADRGGPDDDLLAFERRTGDVTLAQLNRVVGECLHPDAWRAAIAGPGA